MEMPAEHKMVTVPTTRLKNLEVELTALRQAYAEAQAAAQKTGGPQVDPQLAQNYAAKQREYEAQAKHDIDLVEANTTIYEQEIKLLLDVAKNNIATVKKLVGTYESLYSTGKPDQELQAATRAAEAARQAAEMMKRIADRAKEIDMAYGAAWIELRQLSMPADDNVNKEYFRTSRMSIMGRGKLVKAQVEKCKQLTTQAKAYAALSVKLTEQSKGIKAKKADEAKAVDDLIAKLKQRLKKNIVDRATLGWDADGFSWKSKQATLARIAKGAITRNLQSEAASSYKDIEAALKIFRNEVKTMDTLLTTTKRSLSTKGIGKNLKKFAEAERVLEQAQAILKSAQAVERECKESLDIIMRAKV